MTINGAKRFLDRKAPGCREPFTSPENLKAKLGGRSAAVVDGNNMLWKVWRHVEGGHTSWTAEEAKIVNELAHTISSNLQGYFQRRFEGVFSQVVWVFDGPHAPKPYRKRMDESTFNKRLNRASRQLHREDTLPVGKRALNKLVPPGQTLLECVVDALIAAGLDAHVAEGEADPTIGQVVRELNHRGFCSFVISTDFDYAVMTECTGLISASYG